MHLVFVTSLVPDDAPSTGYEIANAAILSALRRQSVRVSVIGYVRPGKQPLDPENTIVLGEIDPATENASFAKRLGWVAGALVSGMTISSSKLRQRTASEFGIALKSLGDCDALVVNAAQMGGAYLTSFAGKKTIYVAHNVEHISAEQNAAAESNIIWKALFTREARLLRDLENRLCADAQFIFTLADADRYALGITAPGQSAVLPLVTRDRLANARTGRQVTYDAGLIGTWTWRPNRIGLEWFLQQVVPHLRDGFSIAVAGSVPDDLRTFSAQVQFVGRVGNADEFVKSCAVIPLVSRAGTGVQLKSIETFELGLPSVATRSSLRGISMLPENCIEADDPVAFAAALEKLADSPVLADGTLFHDAQLRGLDEAVANGLKALGGIRETVPA